MTNYERRMINDTARTYSPSTPGATFKCMLYKDGIYTAVGTGGTVVTSGTRGAAQTFGAIKTGGTAIKQLLTSGGTDVCKNDDHLWGVTFINGKYFFCGDQATVIHGSTYKQVTEFVRIYHPYAKNKIRSICYGAGLYVISGDNGAILTSSDLVTWIERDSTVETDIFDMIWCDKLSRFVGVGSKGTILVSFNGTSWSKANGPYGDDLHGIEYFYSPPYRTKTGVLMPPSHLFIAIADHYHMLTSSSGFGWALNANGSYDGLYDLIHAHGIYIPIGYPGFITTSSI